MKGLIFIIFLGEGTFTTVTGEKMGEDAGGV